MVNESKRVTLQVGGNSQGKVTQQPPAPLLPTPTATSVFPTTLTPAPALPTLRVLGEEVEYEVQPPQRKLEPTSAGPPEQVLHLS